MCEEHANMAYVNHWSRQHLVIADPFHWVGQEHSVQSLLITSNMWEFCSNMKLSFQKIAISKSTNQISIGTSNNWKGKWLGFFKVLLLLLTVSCKEATNTPGIDTFCWIVTYKEWQCCLCVFLVINKALVSHVSRNEVLINL